MMLLKSSTPADEVLPRARVLPSPNTRVLPFALACEEAPWLWKLEVKPAQVWVELLVDLKAAPGPVQVTFTVKGSDSPPPGGPPPPASGAACMAPSRGVMNPGQVSPAVTVAFS